jgi:hypothetical protein
MSKNSNDKVLAEIYSAAGRYILEGGRPPKLLGDQEQSRVIRRVTLASRRLYEALCDDNSTVDTITAMMDEKKRAALDFKRAFNQDWRF